MTVATVFLSLMFVYSLISRQVERTIVTAPALFTVAGMATVVLLPGPFSVRHQEKASSSWRGRVLCCCYLPMRAELTFRCYATYGPAHSATQCRHAADHVVRSPRGASCVSKTLHLRGGYPLGYPCADRFWPRTNHREQSPRASAYPPGAQRGGRPERRAVRTFPDVPNRLGNRHAHEGGLALGILSNHSDNVLLRPH